MTSVFPPVDLHCDESRCWNTYLHRATGPIPNAAVHDSNELPNTPKKVSWTAGFSGEIRNVLFLEGGGILSINVCYVRSRLNNKLKSVTFEFGGGNRRRWTKKPISPMTSSTTFLFNWNLKQTSTCSYILEQQVWYCTQVRMLDVEPVEGIQNFQMSQAKKIRPYSPTKTGCLIRILIMAIKKHTSTFLSGCQLNPKRCWIDTLESPGIAV